MKYENFFPHWTQAVACFLHATRRAEGRFANGIGDARRSLGPVLGYISKRGDRASQLGGETGSQPGATLVVVRWDDGLRGRCSRQPQNQFFRCNDLGIDLPLQREQVTVAGD